MTIETELLLNRFRREHLLGMLSLVVLDLSINGLFNLLAGRADRIATALICELCIFGLGGMFASTFLTRQLRTAQITLVEIDAILRRLPTRTALFGWMLCLIYCGIAFQFGIFFRDKAAVDSIPVPLVYVAGAWFSAMYAVLYGFYLNFLCEDQVVRWRFALQKKEQIRQVDQSGTLLRQIAPIFLFLTLIPGMMAVMDITVFFPVRVAQGLNVEKTLILDLVATLWVIAISLFFVSRSLGLPIASLANAQQRLEGGDLSSRAAVMADNELGQLAISFNTMAVELGEREGLRKAFEQFVDPHVLASILHEDGFVPISREATIMFTDIANFTGWAESLSPEAAFAELNDYLSELTGLIRFYGGTVNNFVGDGVVALFNLPRIQADHANAAVNAALAVQSRMRERNANGKFGPITRIGIHTGPVRAGIIGDAARRSFSVYGDAVNIAARLEQMNKEFNTEILLSRQTANQLDDSRSLNKIGEFPVRGRVGKIEVFSC